MADPRDERGMNDGRTTDLAVVHPEGPTPHTDGSDPVAGVLLAAGGSTRFTEGNALLANIGGTPVVRLAARSLVAAGLEPVVAVLGHDADAVQTALWGLDVRFEYNPSFDTGQATSVRRGVEAVADSPAVVIALGDMPHVAPATITALVQTYLAGHGTALAAAYEGRRGNPVLFDERHFDALRSLTGDVGGRDVLLGCEDGVLVETGDPGVRRDIDTRADLQRCLSE